MEVGEEGHRDSCVLDAAAAAAAGAASSQSAVASPGAVDGVHTVDGLESPGRQISTADAMHSGYEEDFFFDLGMGDDSSSEDGNTSSNPSSPSKGTHSGGDELNDGQERGSASYDEQMFRNIASAGDRYTSLDEFWNIANKTFPSEGEAFSFYNSYAKDKGFGVRKDKVRRATESRALLFRRFVCCKEGVRHGKWLNKDDYSRRPRALTRCDCPALLDIRLDRSRGVWFVQNFVDEHNHHLAAPDEVPFLWSHRKVKDFLKTKIMSMEAAGIRKHVIRDVLQCRYGGYDKVGVAEKDIYNFSSRNKRSRIAKGDARTVLGLMVERQKTDPDFYFDYQLDDDDRLMSMFWCDTESRMDYQSFGDVVIFDSTYRMNRYKMPFVPFVGLNHHRSTTVFGCGIVGDERAKSYVWMLRAFLKAMCHQKPLSIITDGDGSMIKAIRLVLPGINHRICCWHVDKNTPKHLHSKSLDHFRTLMYYANSATFEFRWNAFIARWQTVRNRDWITMMYNNKKLWAGTFQFDKFFLGMKSNQSSGKSEFKSS